MQTQRLREPDPPEDEDQVPLLDQWKEPEKKRRVKKRVDFTFKRFLYGLYHGKSPSNYHLGKHTVIIMGK